MLDKIGSASDEPWKGTHLKWKITTEYVWLGEVENHQANIL